MVSQILTSRLFEGRFPQVIGNLVSFLKRPSSSLDSRCLVAKRIAGLVPACKSAKSGFLAYGKPFISFWAPMLTQKPGRKGHGTASRSFHMLLFTKNCAIP